MCIIYSTKMAIGVHTLNVSYISLLLRLESLDLNSYLLE